MQPRRSHSAWSWLPAAAAALLSAAPVQADSPGWGSSRGGPERDGHRAGNAELARPQAKWRARLGGGLGTTAYWLDDLGLPAVYVATGGRVRARQWDDTPLWETPLDALDQVIAAIDRDGDGVRDTVIATGSGASPVVGAFGRLGSEAWIAPAEALAPIAGARVVDLNGDGSLDVYVTFTRASATGAAAAAFDLSRGLADVRLMWTLPAADRDYVAGYQDLIAELDGTPGLEIVVAGHRHLYTYDAATGALESTSAELPVLPYGRATLRVVDVDGDGTSEVAAMSNQAWAAPENRRYVGLFAWDNDIAALAPRWDRAVADQAADRVSFSDDTFIDLDQDGTLEAVFSVYDAAQASWTLEVRDAGSGTLLAQQSGSRFAGVAAGRILVVDEGLPLETYVFSRALGLERQARGPSRAVASCRVQQVPLSTSIRHTPCVVVLQGGSQGVVVMERQAVSGRGVALEALDLSTEDLAASGRYAATAGAFVSSVAAMPQPSPAKVVLALTDGRLLPLDAELLPVAPDPEIPYAWPGVSFGTSFSGYDLPAFPLAVPTPATAERVLAVAGGGTVVQVVDASRDPTFAGGVEISWRAIGSARGVVVDGVTPEVVTIDPDDGLENHDAATGALLWQRGGLFSSADGLILHSDPLVVGGAMPRLWFHRRDSNRGANDLTAVELGTGEIGIYTPDLDLNNQGWRRLSIDADGHPMSGQLTSVWRFSMDGSVLDQTPVPSGTMAVSLGDPDRFLSVGLATMSAHVAGDPGSVWSVSHSNSAGSAVRQGARLTTSSATYFAIVEPTSSRLVVYDVSTGNRVAAVTLVGGEATDPSPPPSPAPSLANVTALDDIDGNGTAAWVVGGSDGFLYAVAADGSVLLWSVFVGAAAGEIVPIDWDGDGALELVVSVADGALVGLDSYTGDPPAEVLDIDPPKGILDRDVDSLSTESTLFATWTAVAGASSYNVAVFTSTGSPVTDGFVDVGNVTRVDIDGLELESGQRYTIAVRAVSALGVSPDALSDGVTVYRQSTSTSGTPEGCGCDSMERATRSLVLIVLTFLILRMRKCNPRRRRMRARDRD
ncbi:MAG: fibronectin type III domain-containing protein [Myxococcales bacterium]|nr:fibronectin type III domain-containing protein [Myxococcales bacterium]